MPTLYEKLQEYYESGDEILTHNEKIHVGQIVFKCWNTTFPLVSTLYQIYQKEDTGTFKVNVYPDYFTPHIDGIIKAFYQSKKRKKRIPYVKKPIFSTSYKPKL